MCPGTPTGYVCSLWHRQDARGVFLNAPSFWFQVYEASSSSPRRSEAPLGGGRTAFFLVTLIQKNRGRGFGQVGGRKKTSLVTTVILMEQGGIYKEIYKWVPVEIDCFPSRRCLGQI